jgi:hypothetical protein
MKWSKTTAQGFSPGLGHQGTHPERVTDEWCFFQEAAFIATVVTIGSTVTYTEIFQGNEARYMIEAPFGRPFRARLVSRDSQG